MKQAVLIGVGMVGKTYVDAFRELSDKVALRGRAGPQRGQPPRLH